ncbi:MAG: DNA repair protein RadC [Gammaproteobacteria bacterium]
MPITDWPLQERPREKLLARGANALSDAELVAILLRCGIRGKTALDIARDLLATHGGLRALFNASAATICSTAGLGLHTFTHLQAVKELGKRYAQESLVREDAVSHIAATKQYLHAKLHDYGHEVFACLFLDNRHRLIKFIELFHGTINQAVVHPREVVKQSLHYNAVAVIIAHNHPSGEVLPSAADLALTKQLKEALQLVEIKLLDHIIVGGNKTFSCAEMGYL